MAFPREQCSPMPIGILPVIQGLALILSIPGLSVYPQIHRRREVGGYKRKSSRLDHPGIVQDHYGCWVERVGERGMEQNAGWGQPQSLGLQFSLKIFGQSIN